ncbi:PD-(D/E)XK nuclease family protein [Plectonema cf. radiosum LEGE 06105]|uniref:PD-(D/E)XK nuclease family protein n=1 Tax=Plectonema cf. radiosum LEGE 06105 TaxID=945769 RepID=A0A8J7K0N9_9CYAN|nr:PD-(D/E)XK nuclease family protein [Plectonema radiosum]MBE9212737.1 PD-(D/E)XK nuclease family protein [Plectonema cf. radiosum LEGE 06105]
MISITNLPQNQLLRISQGQLNLLERCPREFQHTYLEQLRPPINPENQEKQLQGSRFHLLMQQQEMGLEIDKFLQADENDKKDHDILQLQNWIKAFAIAAPEILTEEIANSETFRESEHYRTLQVENYLLTAIYDLLIANPEQAEIFDWKTYPKPESKRKLQYNWQTRLYLYLLAETSDYPPEKISMTYWFVQSQSKPHNIKFSYNSSQHQQTKKKLNQHLNRLTQWLEAYQQGEQFPQLSEGSKTCNYCQYASRCQRQIVVSDTKSSSENLPGVDVRLVNLANIQEVPIKG